MLENFSAYLKQKVEPRKFGSQCHEITQYSARIFGSLLAYKHMKRLITSEKWSCVNLALGVTKSPSIQRVFLALFWRVSA